MVDEPITQHLTAQDYDDRGVRATLAGADPGDRHRHADPVGAPPSHVRRNLEGPDRDSQSDTRAPAGGVLAYRARLGGTLAAAQPPIGLRLGDEHSGMAEAPAA
jgi:hypothetical protein